MMMYGLIMGITIPLPARSRRGAAGFDQSTYEYRGKPCASQEKIIARE